MLSLVWEGGVGHGFLENKATPLPPPHTHTESQGGWQLQDRVLGGTLIHLQIAILFRTKWGEKKTVGDWFCSPEQALMF